MSLIDLVQEKIVKIPLVSTDKADVLRELVQILKDAGEIEDYDAVLRAICEREEKLSTGLESGIAVPHGKTEAVSTLKLALGIAPQGIDFASIDRKPSQLFFMLVAPPNQSGPHVEALAEIAADHSLHLRGTAPAGADWDAKLDGILSYPSQLETIFRHYVGVEPSRTGIGAALAAYATTEYENNVGERFWTLLDGATYKGS